MNFFASYLFSNVDKFFGQSWSSFVLVLSTVGHKCWFLVKLWPLLEHSWGITRQTTEKKWKNKSDTSLQDNIISDK